MITLLLQRKREISGLSLSQVSNRLGTKSRNSYARYEQGRSVPSVEKLNKAGRSLIIKLTSVVGRDKTTQCQEHRD